MKVFGVTNLLSILVILWSSSSTLATFSTRVTEKRILDNLLDPKTYDRRIRPNAHFNATNDAINRPITDTVNIYVRDIDYICDDRNEWKAQLTVRQEWTDSRLVYDSVSGKIKYLSVTDPSLVWTPDTFFVNERSGSRHGVLSDNNLLRIKSNGDVSYTTKFTVTLSCAMNLKKYPFDNQVCKIKLSSYGLTIEDMLLAWKNGSDGIQVNRDCQASGKFSLRGFTTDTCSTDSKGEAGVYPCLVASFEFQRNSSWHLRHVFIPTTFFVILSYLSLWLDGRNVRYLLSVSSLLFSSLHLNILNTSYLPKTPFTKPIDVWTGICLTLSFISLLIIIGLEKYSKYLALHEQTPKPSGNTDLPLKEVSQTDKTTEDAETGNMSVNKTRLQSLDREKVENGCLALYPMVFITFIFIFWIAFGRRNYILSL